MTRGQALLGVLWLVCVGGCRRSGDAAGAAGAFQPLAVGDTVPAYATRTLAGDTVRIGATGTVMLVNVWATWCVSCREEMGDLEELYRAFGPRGLHVVAISVDNGDDTRVRRFAEDQHLTIPIAHDAAGIVEQRLSTVGVPESYLISGDGHLLWHQIGGLHGNVSAARTAVDVALGRAPQ